MHSQLIQIGNSKGLRLPKAILRQCGIDRDVELEVADGALIVRAAPAVRQGWAQAAQDVAAKDVSTQAPDVSCPALSGPAPSGDAAPLLEGVPNAWDEDGWRW